MLRLVHTSDWHLGHVLHDASREWEHERFLAWLLDVLADRAAPADALVVTGDVFDQSNPPATALRAWYGFLAAARRRRPGLQVVAIAGNHDSGARLEAPAEVLAEQGVRVVGRLPRRVDGGLDADALVVPLSGASGAVEAWCAAVPFLRTSDLPPASADGDPLVEGVRAVYAEVVAAARARRAPGQALVATGHAYVMGTRLSEASERKILGGNLHALPADVFPPDLAYVALGHLHLPQAVGRRETVRYAGSPIPLALDEATYPHQAVRVTIDGGEARRVETLLVPRSVDVLRLPEDGPRPLAEVLDLLGRLPEAEGDARAWPWLEVRVRLDAPEPALKARVLAALAGKAARLLRIARAEAGTGAALGDVRPVAELGDLDPEEVFRERWRRDREGDPPAGVLALFREALDEVRSAEEGP